MRRLVVLPALALVVATSVVGRLPALAAGDELDCLIEPYVVAALSTRAEGVIETLTVDRGDVIKQGQVLAMLESSVERAALAVTTARVEPVNKRVTELEIWRGVAELNARLLRSPINGVVLQRLLAVGEHTRQSPIFKVAQIDPLRVEVFAPIALLGKLAVGTRAAVMPEAPIGGTHTAKVTVIDRVADAASGTFGVRLELPNPGHRIPAGLKCKVRFP